MVFRALLQLIDAQSWLQPVEEAVHSAIHGLYGALGGPGRALKDFLHGVWLGHPLHSALTDIPIGAWTVATVLDTIGWMNPDDRSARTIERGADGAVAIGIVGAVGSALTGLTDWSETYGRTRRIGIVHALLNSIALILFIASWMQRRAGRRQAARWTALSGYGGVLLSAWLGGEMVYGEAVMVNHTAWQEGPEDWLAVARDSELPAGTRERPAVKRVVAQGVPIMLIRQGQDIFAIAATCAHAGGPLAEGEIKDGIVTCPWHGSQYRIRDGSLVHGPSTYDQPRYDVRITNGWIEIRQGTALTTRESAA